MQQTIGFEGKLHGVGAHISGLDDADARNRNPFGVSLTTHKQNFVCVIGRDTADDVLSTTNFQGLDPLGNSAHEGDLFGGEGEAKDPCAGGGDNDFSLGGEGSDGMEFVVFAEFDQGGTSVCESTQFLEQDPFDFTLDGKEQEFAEIFGGFGWGMEGINYRLICVLQCGN